MKAWRAAGLVSAVSVRAVSSRAASTDLIRVVHWNIHGWRDASHTDALDRIVSVLTELSPDIVCLNEVLDPFVAPETDDPYWGHVRERRGYGYSLAPVPEGTTTQLMRLAEALGMREHVSFGAATVSTGFFGRVPFGNCVLSRHELVDVRHTVLRVTADDFRLGEQERTADDLEDRAVLTAVVRLPGGRELGVCSTHLDHRAEELRKKQIARALQLCRDAFDGRRAPARATGAGDAASGEGSCFLGYCLCGDLNSFDEGDLSEAGWDAIRSLYSSRGWPPPHSRSLVQAELEGAGMVDTHTLARQAVGPSHPPPTCWTGTRLDYVMLSAEAAASLRVLSHTTLQTDASDQ